MLSFRFVQTHITDRSLLTEVLAAVLGSSANRGLPRDLLYSVVKVHRENLSPHFISEIFWGIHNLGIPLFTKCLHFVEHEEILFYFITGHFLPFVRKIFRYFRFFITFLFVMVWKVLPLLYCWLFLVLQPKKHLKSSLVSYPPYLLQPPAGAKRVQLSRTLFAGEIRSNLSA